MTKTPVSNDLLFGIHPVIELLKAKKRKLLALYTTKPTPKEWKAVERVMPAYPVPVNYVPRDALHRMAGTTDHQGVVAYAQPFCLHNKPFDVGKQPFVVLLDAIQDPRNLGAIIRSAYCTGVSGIVLCKKNSAPLSGVALKASAGLAEHVPIRVVSSPQAAVEELKSAGYTIYLALLEGEDARTCAFTKPLCLVIGNEATGITKGLYKSGTHVTLPQKTDDISYNASVAAGILFFLAGSKNNLI
jgi:23S rRNA (guanosine2251-2'-O)-methyltransferase